MSSNMQKRQCGTLAKERKCCMCGVAEDGSTAAGPGWQFRQCQQFPPKERVAGRKVQNPTKIRVKVFKPLDDFFLCGRLAPLCADRLGFFVVTR
jgi:hypothetical protein